MSEYQRNRPAGVFIENFRLPGDTRSHCERINPLDGLSFGACPGAQRGFQPQPLATYAPGDIPVRAQFAG